VVVKIKLRTPFFLRKESSRPTWKRRLAFLILLMLVVLIISVTREFWSKRIGQSLVCTEHLSQSDLILVENLDQDYLLFEQAATLHKAGFAARVLIPVQISHESERANAVSIGTAELMARVAQMQTPEIMPIRAPEPVSLNVAYGIRDFLIKEHLSSVIIVTSGFRSKRSSLIYQAVLPPGITVSCIAVFVGAAPENWSQTWHGIEEVTEQFLKLQFYRFYVLLKPVSLKAGTDPDSVYWGIRKRRGSRQSGSAAVVPPSQIDLDNFLFVKASSVSLWGHVS